MLIQAEKHFFTIIELAVELGMSCDTIYRWVRKGLVAVVRLPSGRYRIPVAEVERICTTNTVSPDTRPEDSDEASA
jgi:excisionase family DNA binding protein